MIGALALVFGRVEAGFVGVGEVRSGQICRVGDTFRDTVWPEKPNGTDESLSSSAFNGRDPGGCGGLDSR
jgi:hypothetical protein